MWSIKSIVAIVIAFVAIILIVAAWPFATIGAGERGVVTNLGAFSRVIGPGFHWVVPFTEDVITFDVRTQKEQTDASAASKDLQTVNATVAVNYNIDPEKVSDLYVNVGTEFKSKIIDPAVQEVVKAAMAKYTAEELVTKRAQLTDEIQTALKTRLGEQHILVSSVSVINFNFSKAFDQAIEDKVTAEQNAQAAKNKLEQVKYEAEQKIETAKAEAEAIKIQAQAINSQGGADYVELQRIQKWNGQGCTSYCNLGASTGLLVNGK